MNEKKTILHVIDYMGRGGAEVMLVKVLKELKEYRNIVVTLNPENHFGDEFSSDEYHCLHMGSFARFPVAVLRLKKLIRNNPVDIVHSHLLSSTLVARLAVPQKIPLVTTIHTTVSAAKGYQKWYLKALEKFTYGVHKSTIVVVSHGALEEYFTFLRHKPYKKYVLHTFVDLKEMNTATSKRTGTGTFRLIAIGAVRDGKNHEFLVKAFSLLKNDNVELDIYGSGNLYEPVKKLIERSGVKITLKGEVKNASKLLNQYDLYVMPSQFEGFSLSVLEAMAMEVPMLLSDIPSFREQCADTAVFFDLKDINDFAGKLRMLAADASMRNRLAGAARQRVLDNFTLEHHMKGLRKIYSDTLNDN